MNAMPKLFTYSVVAPMGMKERLFWFHVRLLCVFVCADLYVKQVYHFICMSWSYSNLILIEYVYVYLHAFKNDAANQPYRTPGVSNTGGFVLLILVDSNCCHKGI